MLIQKTGVKGIFDRDTLLHLRLPFSFILMPVFVFAISQQSNIHATETLLLFVVLHLFIYPASNVYNSYMDRDQGSIGGLRHPPAVSRRMYVASLWLDGAGLLLCVLIHPVMALMMLVYIGVSKAYSWHGIRLKRFAAGGWAVVVLFQGAYTYWMVQVAASGAFTDPWPEADTASAMLLATLMIGAYYPLTQIYQHAEDGSRGDRTISLLLGIRGTFVFSAMMFGAACVWAYGYFNSFYQAGHFWIFLLCLSPALIYFLFWSIRSFKEPALADYNHTMRMTLISSACLLLCYAVLLWRNNPDWL